MKLYSLPFFPTTVSFLSLTLEGLFEMTWRPSRALDSPQTLLPELQSRDKSKRIVGFFSHTMTCCRGKHFSLPFLPTTLSFLSWTLEGFFEPFSFLIPGFPLFFGSRLCCIELLGEIEEGSSATD